MHVYLPEKYRSPFLHGVLLSSKVWVSDSKLRRLFSLLLTRVISCDLDHLEGLDIIILLCPPPFYFKGCQFCPMFFLERESWSQPYQMFLIALSLIMPPSIQFGFGDEAIWRFGFWHGVVFMQNFSEFQSYSSNRNHFDIDSKQTHSEEIQVIPMKRFSEVMKTFCFDFWWKIWSDIWLVTKGWNFNLRVNENRFYVKNTKWHLVGHKKV